MDTPNKKASQIREHLFKKKEKERERNTKTHSTVFLYTTETHPG